MAKKNDKTCKVVAKLPKDADPGECFTLRRNKRLITFKRNRPSKAKKKRNLKWTITANQPAGRKK